MEREKSYETATMARVYAQQGYLRYAAQIYRRLLSKAPHREALQKELADIEHRIAEQHRPSRKELGLLLRQWAELVKQKKELHERDHISE